MRSESAFQRVQWLYAINIFSQNLTDDLQIINYPIYKGKELRKTLSGIDSEVGQFTNFMEQRQTQIKHFKSTRFSSSESHHIEEELQILKNTQKSILAQVEKMKELIEDKSQII